MSNQRILEQEIAALDNLIGRQLELIDGIKERLRKGVEALDQEINLLRELTNEIVLLREFRETRFIRSACLKQLERNPVLIESEAGASLPVRRGEPGTYIAPYLSRAVRDLAETESVL